MRWTCARDLVYLAVLMMNEKHDRHSDMGHRMAQSSTERSPLLERVPVGERQPYDRYPHQTVRSVCPASDSRIKEQLIDYPPAPPLVHHRSDRHPRPYPRCCRLLCGHYRAERHLW